MYKEAMLVSNLELVSEPNMNWFYIRIGGDIFLFTASLIFLMAPLSSSPTSYSPSWCLSMSSIPCAHLIFHTPGGSAWDCRTYRRDNPYHVRSDGWAAHISESMVCQSDLLWFYESSGRSPRGCRMTRHVANVIHTELLLSDHLNARDLLKEGETSLFRMIHIVSSVWVGFMRIGNIYFLIVWSTRNYLQIRA